MPLYGAMLNPINLYKVDFRKLTFQVRVLHFYCPQRSCGKVMFLHMSVSHSVHRGGLCPSMQHRSHDQGGSLSGGVSVQGGGLCPRGSPSGRPPLNTVTRGRYASYWNAFLLFFSLVARNYSHNLIDTSKYF